VESAIPLRFTDKVGRVSGTFHHRHLYHGCLTDAQLSMPTCSNGEVLASNLDVSHELDAPWGKRNVGIFVDWARKSSAGDT
jgi:hypothetical protein